METEVPQPLAKALKKQRYHLVGKHSAVKGCKWLHEALTNGRSCYKAKFYGIKSHQCIQMSPAIFSCTQQCMFCWRAQNSDLKIKWNETQTRNWDSPESIVHGSIHAQERILSGYKGNLKTDLQKLREALTPKHVAISLAGEPTLYEPLGELIEEFHKRRFTTFLVTNGTNTKRLKELEEEPTQLYVSVCAPNEQVFKSVCRPQIENAWTSLNSTLDLLPSYSCPTVIRMTLVRELNMRNLEEYAKLIEKAGPTYIETKAYMHVGFSNLRLTFERMPSHGEIRAFAAELSSKTGYKIIDESTDSRVVLLSKKERAKRFDQN
jgi:tRNA wybutosine-synthesizing protein 1